MQKNFWDALLDNILPWRVYLRVGARAQARTGRH